MPAAALSLHQKTARSPEKSQPEPERLPESKRVWDTRKAAADVVQGIYRRSPDEALQKHADKLYRCSRTLEVDEVLNRETGELSTTVKSWKCRERHCPVCQSARQFKFKRHFEDALPTIQERAKADVWLHLVLTVENCPIDQLRQTLAAMNTAWRKLVQRKEFRIVRGWTRGTEVTQGKNGPMMAHPHFHALLLVPAGYFKRGYIKHEKWVSLWQECAKLPGRPSVHIERADAKGGIREVVKLATYSTKPEEMNVSEGWFYEFHRQVSGLRFLATGGIVKDVLREKEAERKRERQARGETADEPEEANDIEGQLDPQGETVSSKLFGWREQAGQYHRAKKGDRS